MGTAKTLPVKLQRHFRILADTGAPMRHFPAFREFTALHRPDRVDRTVISVEEDACFITPHIQAQLLPVRSELSVFIDEAFFIHLQRLSHGRDVVCRQIDVSRPATTVAATSALKVVEDCTHGGVTGPAVQSRPIRTLSRRRHRAGCRPPLCPTSTPHDVRV